jgi:hypothetical protein
VVVRQVQGLAVVGGQRDDLADGAVRDPTTDLGHVREVPGPHRLHGEDPPLLRRRENVLDLGTVARQCFLDEYVLSGADGQEGVLAVAGVR